MIEISLKKEKVEETMLDKKFKKLFFNIFDENSYISRHSENKNVVKIISNEFKKLIEEIYIEDQKFKLKPIFDFEEKEITLNIFSNCIFVSSKYCFDDEKENISITQTLDNMLKKIKILENGYENYYNYIDEKEKKEKKQIEEIKQEMEEIALIMKNERKKQEDKKLEEMQETKNKRKKEKEM